MSSLFRLFLGLVAIALFASLYRAWLDMRKRR